MAENQNFNNLSRDYAAELLELIRSEIPHDEIKTALENYHESDIAEIVPELTIDERLLLYKLLGDEMVSDVFTYLDDVEQFVEELSNERVADIIEEMDADDAIEVLDELNKEKREQIIELLDAETASDIKLINDYDEDVIGSRMTTNFISIRHTLTIKEAMKSVIKQAADNDNVSTIYAVNDDRTYYGALTLHELVIARHDTPLDSLISTAYPCLYADERINDCVEELRNYNEDSIPILTRNNLIVGVITSSELFDVVDEKFKDDFVKFGGVSEQEDLEEPLVNSLKKRLPWLVTLMLLGLIVSSLISLFADVITALPILVGFQSMVFAMSGNVGTQSLAITIRVITGDDLSARERLKLVFKELKIGFINGLLIGIVTMLICSVYIYFARGAAYDIQSYFQALRVSACIGAALVVAMSFASLSGTLVPLIFKKVKIDPAVASGPLITTINDMIAATVYYGLAWLFLMSV